MASKARVHELAKEFNTTSKKILQQLSELGEFVKSASSTVEAPVARKLKEKYYAGHNEANTDAQKNSRSDRTTATAGSASNKSTSSNSTSAASPAQSSPARPAAPAPHEVANKTAPSQPAETSTPPTPGSSPASPQPSKPTPTSPSALSQGAKPTPRPPRVANNPYSTSQSAPNPNRIPRPGKPKPKPGAAPGGPGGVNNRTPKPGAMPKSGMPRTGGAPKPHDGRRPGGPRPGGRGPGAVSHGAPNPGAMPRSPRPGGPRPSMPTGGPRTSNFPGSSGGFNAAPPVGGGGPPRGRGGRGSAGGAFGRQGSPSSKKSRKAKKQKKKAEFDMLEAPELGGIRLPRGEGQVIRLARGASLSDFAEKIQVNPASLVQVLFKLGEMVTATQSVSEDTLQLLGAEMNFEVQVVSPEDEDRELLENFDLSFGEDEGGEEELEQRPPVVTVMGHVDHGKTRLLDTLRKTNVREGEAGGITQHIGAYQVSVDFDGATRPITFIDTPGHEAFTAMRARGAKATDIAVLVVAADDGVMPQTVEAINHAQAADVPIVVAVNKIDKPEANPEKIRAQLTEFNLVPEEYGGSTLFVDISAREGRNIESLLEAILLTADAELELQANPHMAAQAVAIESHLDRGRGPVATVLIQRGTLRVGDSIVAGGAYGRVRRMVDENGNDVVEAQPSRPVQVIGFTSVPGAGDSLLVVEEDRIARQIADRRNARKRNALQAKAKKRVSLEDLNSALQDISQLNVILKGDNAGTVEALEEALLGLDISEEVELRVIDRGVGGVTETNVNLAAASDAIIIAFNVRPEGKAGEVANREGVELRYYSVIYQAIDDVEKALKGMLKPIYEEKPLGQAEIRQIFKSSKFGIIAGCLIIEGTIKRNAQARLIRDSSVVQEKMSVSSLRREKDDVTEVRDGYECGMTLTYSDFKVGDIIDAYELVEKPRT